MSRTDSIQSTSPLRGLRRQTPVLGVETPSYVAMPLRGRQTVSVEFLKLMTLISGLTEHYNNCFYSFGIPFQVGIFLFRNTCIPPLTKCKWKTKICSEPCQPEKISEANFGTVLQHSAGRNLKAKESFLYPIQILWVLSGNELSWKPRPPGLESVPPPTWRSGLPG